LAYVEGLAAHHNGQNLATKRHKTHKTFPNIMKDRKVTVEESVTYLSREGSGAVGRGPGGNKNYHVNGHLPLPLGQFCQ